MWGDTILRGGASMTPPHISTHPLRALVIVLALAGCASTVSAQAHRYAVQDLGQADGTSSVAVAINDDGVIAGRIEASHDDTHAARAVDGHALQYIPELQRSLSDAVGVNAWGDLAGSMVVSQNPWAMHAIRHTAAHGVEDLGGFGGNSFGVSINRWGQVAGFVQTGSAFRAFVATPGQGLTSLGTLSGAGSSFAGGINDAGQVAGHSETTSGAWHAFRYTPGLGLKDLGTTADADTYASAINATGQVVGRTERATGTHAFRYTDGIGIEDLHTLPASISEATGINNAGAVVGYVYTSGTPSRAFLYTDAEGMIDLNNRLDPASGWVLNAAFGINNAGEIVGQGTYRDQAEPRAFKLTPYVADVTAPDIAGVTADPSILWPANLHMVSVRITVDVTDNADPAPRCRIVDVVSSEPTDDGAVKLTGDLTLDLRAARSGSADGRTYRVSVACADASGNVARTTVAVQVPHDQSEAQGK
jgi:probable HAF family extracellular repeat protein